METLENSKKQESLLMEDFASLSKSLNKNSNNSQNFSKTIMALDTFKFQSANTQTNYLPTAQSDHNYKNEVNEKLTESATDKFSLISSSKTHSRDNQNSSLTPVIPGSGGALIFVIVSFIVLMLITIAWLLSYYIQRFRQLRMTTRVHRRRQQLAKRAIAQIPTRILESIHSDDEDAEKPVLEGGFDYRMKLKKSV